MKTFIKLEYLPSNGDIIAFAFQDIAEDGYRGVNGSDGMNILDCVDIENRFTVVRVSELGGMITANHTKTGNSFTMNGAHWRPIKDTTPIDWEIRKRVYRHNKKHHNVSLTSRVFGISRRSVGRIVNDIDNMNWFKRSFIRMGL